ncbi:hypothetical protein C0J52_10893 [Blattella germanica]|nr:hypothetical protein C0J52_10893 [Blattella germanica]
MSKTVRKVFIGILEGRRRRGRPRKRWNDDVEEDLRRIEVGCWRRTANDRVGAGCLRRLLFGL